MQVAIDELQGLQVSDRAEAPIPPPLSASSADVGPPVAEGLEIAHVQTCAFDPSLGRSRVMDRLLSARHRAVGLPLQRPGSRGEITFRT